MQPSAILASSVYRKHLALLNLYRFVDQPAFHDAYNTATVDERKQAEKLITQISHIELIAWTKMILRKNKLFELLDVRYLRDVARDHGIRNYTIMTRLELLMALKKRETA